MAVVEVAVSDLVYYESRPLYDKNGKFTGRYIEHKWVFPGKTTLRKNHTYLVVFAVGQEDWEEKFLEEYKDWIIYKAPKAINKNYSNYGGGYTPRLQLYVLEKP